MKANQKQKRVYAWIKQKTEHNVLQKRLKFGESEFNPNLEMLI